ncbi:DUF4209 domain-containing protein [Nostoc sp. CHAB 5834]|nr:DUF4209 domain-containing protein [Nostoc sp. CHAB 5834]
MNQLTSKGSSTEIDPWATQEVATRLANYYKRLGKQLEVKRVILTIGDTFSQASSKVSSSQKVGWLEQVHRIYNQYDLKEEAGKILIQIRELGPESSSEMKLISHSFSIPKSDLDNYVNYMTSGDANEVLEKIAIHYIPREEDAKNQILDLAKRTPFLFMLTHQIKNDQGRILATIGPLESDLEGNIIRRISENLNFASPVLREVFKKLINDKILSKSDLINFINSCPIINEKRHEIIKIGVSAYFKGDYIIFIHLLIPQIEDAIRNIVAYSGGNTWKLTRRGDAYHVKTFDEILRDPLVIQALNKDMTNYLRLLFTESRGWNLRNDVCHGLSEYNKFNAVTADRVLHALLCIGLVSTVEK